MVTDQRSDLRIPLRLVSGADPGRSGRGLRILADLAYHWGVGYSQADQRSKTVWCQFGTPTEHVP
jgi:hypothetical protein